MGNIVGGLVGGVVSGIKQGGLRTVLLRAALVVVGLVALMIWADNIVQEGLQGLIRMIEGSKNES